MPDHTSIFPLEHNPDYMLQVHHPDRCAGQACSIHNRSNHSMRMFPQHWRGDRQLMERICPHGIGHPDPDHISFTKLLRGEAYAVAESSHGCDGCCR